MKFVPYDKTAEVLQPCKQSFNLPAATVAPQGATVLCFGALSPIWSNHFNAPVLFQLGVELIAVVGFVSNEPFGKLAGKTSVQGRFNQSHLMRRRAGHVYGERNTRSVCHCHDLGALAALCFTNGTAPFFAGANVPSMNASRRSSLPRSRRSSAKANRTASKIPSLRQRWNHLWQVWYGGYLGGKSFQCAPVLRIHRIPFNTSRGSLTGLPCPIGPLGGFGRSVVSRSHCSFVMSIPFSCRKRDQKSINFLEMAHFEF